MPYGNDGTLAINFQNSYGTSEVASLYFIPLNDEDITLSIEDLVSGEMRGIFDEGGSYAGKREAAGAINVDADMESLGVFLRAVMGPATFVASDSLGNHTFKPRTADFDKYASSDPMTILVDLNDGGSAQQYYDMVATSLEFGISGGELYKLNMSIAGGKHSQIAAVAASYSVNSKMPWDITSYRIAAAGITDLLDINVKIDEKVEAKFVIDGTKTPGYMKRTGPRTIEVSGTMLFNDQVEYQEFLSQSERILELLLNSGNEVQSGYNEFIQIYIPRFRYTAFPVALSGPEQLEASFTGKAKYDAASQGFSMAVTLTNTHAAY